MGTYDLSKLTGAEAKIDAASTVTYTLSLEQRQDNGGYAPVGDISNYITVLGSDYLGTGAASADGNSYVFTDTKTNGAFLTRDGNSLAFKHAFRVKVNTNVEGENQTYANYRLVLTANIIRLRDVHASAHQHRGHSARDENQLATRGAATTRLPPFFLFAWPTAAPALHQLSSFPLNLPLKVESWKVKWKAGKLGGKLGGSA